MKSDEEVRGLVDHLFRQEYSRLVATLTRAFGLGGLQVSEDIVQETLVAAMHYWSVRGVPENPSAWLMQVAKNKAINHIKRRRRENRVHGELSREAGPFTEVSAFLESDIEDNMLRMVFACCHPELPEESQIGLILKTLCGLGSTEAARALLVTQDAFDKRIYRAKRQIRRLGIRFEIPDDAQLTDRLDIVCKCLYLLFNEGYSTTGSEELVRRDLCGEAMRLCRLVIQRYPDAQPIYALLALMFFHAARFDTRISSDGSLVVLRDQDRSAWDQELIQQGLYYLSESAAGDELSRYHLEASIAAQHCMSPSYDETNWRFIRMLYEQLDAKVENPIVKLNLAIVARELEGSVTADELLSELETDRTLQRYPLFHATRGEVCLDLGKTKEAAMHLQRALEVTTSAIEREFLGRKLDEISQARRSRTPPE